MNVPEMLDAKYTNPEIPKLINIFKRTKKKRIKNKTFAKLLILCIKEKSVVRYNGAAILSMDYYNELMQKIEGMSELVGEYEKLKNYHTSNLGGVTLEKQKPKRYQHFKKGTIYEEKAIVHPIGDKEKPEFTLTALHSETLEEVAIYPISDGFYSDLTEDYVLYFNIEEPFKLWLREFNMFHETIERDGKVQRRFKPIE